MKNQAVTRKTETLEDIVFEGRNKSYGAYELHRKSSKYLLIAFLISFAGVTTSIAVPFINSMKSKGLKTVTYDSGGYKLTKVDPVNPEELPPPPPPPPIIEAMEKQLSYKTPEIVEKAEDSLELGLYSDLLENTANKPVDPEIIPIVPQGDVIVEPMEDIVFNPQEEASFNGGTLEDFRNWVIENIAYPEEAAGAGIFGKVFVEFCVNKRGDVVDVKILRKLHPAIDEETIRVITSSPKWTPAKQGGNPVKQRFTIPFSFEVI